ncbi:hypothetical protein GE376_30480 (plasmid) [Bacillus cereus]|uniref:hypothetical protein n=1 Tax=Bacillus cereus TaxID=1396 RepID=UPI0012925BB5|nr:hypothetical protein [Bacillus cereus]QFY03482.1 hypothetical protein GE376_30480 [Bacillus cereus]
METVIGIIVIISFFSILVFIRKQYQTYFNFFEIYQRYLKKYENERVNEENSYLKDNYLHKLGKKSTDSLKYSGFLVRFRKLPMCILVMLVLCGFIICLILLFFIVPQANLLHHIFSYVLDISYLKDIIIKHSSLIRNVVVACNGLLAGIITLMITLYTFSFRERKANAISINTLTKNKWFFVHIAFVFFSLIYGWLTINMLPKAKDTIVYDHETSLRLLLFAILILLSSFMIIGEMNRFFKGLNLKEATKEMLSDIKSLLYLNALSFGNLVNYKQLENYIESFYQFLALSYEKNIYELSSQHFEEWLKVLQSLVIGPEKNEVEFLSRPVFDLLNKKDKTAFKNVYALLIRCHVELIITIMKCNRLTDLQRAVNGLLYLKPYVKDDELKEIYLTTLHELVLYTIENQPERISVILQVLEEVSSSEFVSDNDTPLKIYKSLVIKSVMNNSVMDLSGTSYSMIKVIREYLSNPHPKTKKINGILIGHNLNTRSHMTQVKAVIYNLLQANLKTIELSHYQCTGFLMKMMVTVFHDVELFKEVFSTLVNGGSQQGENNPYIKDKKQSKVEITPNFNTNTFDYCCDKLAILLYAQRKYALQNDLPFQFKNQRDVSDFDIVDLKECIRHREPKYLFYLFTKICAGKDKYGLLFLKDKDFMEGIMKDVFIQLGVPEDGAKAWQYEMKK